MNRAECRYEGDVLEAVSMNRWPDRVHAGLREHVTSCALCSDLVVVASAFEEDCAAARAAAPVPGSGIVWWRAQMRARQEATRTAVRPITVAQAVAFAATVGIVGAFFGATAAWFQRVVGWLGGTVTAAFAFRLPELPPWVVALVTDHTLLVTGGVVAFLLAPVALYLLVRLTERTA